MSNKTLHLTPELYQYLLQVSLHEHPVLAELRAETAKMNERNMQIAPEQGQFMALLIQLIGARKGIEIGVFTGYSATAVALAMPAEGKIIACDVSVEWTSIAKRYWQKAGIENKIELHLQPALKTVDELIAKGETNTFDYAFIDANKENYLNYYEKVLTLIRPNGVILIDNTLWNGAVCDKNIQDAETNAIRAVNERVFRDDRVNAVLLPIGDGLSLIRKK